MKETQIIRDNGHNEREVFKGLSVGDKLICVKEKIGLCDGGNINFLWHGARFIEGEIYTIKSVSSFGFYSNVPWVLDEDGCTTFAESKYFKTIDNEVTGN